jgi:hypothetical protein
MEILGWFWGSIRTMLLKDPQTVMRDPIGEGEVFQCEICDKLFSSVASVNRNHAQEHSDAKIGANASNRQMYQTVVAPGRLQPVASRREPGDEADPPQQRNEESEVIRPAEERREARVPPLRMPQPEEMKFLKEC